MKLNLVSEADLTRPEMDNIKLRLHRVEAREISAVTLGAIPSSLLTTRGDIIVRNATVPDRLALTVPASPIINFLGVANGETQPSWKSASSNPGGTARLLQTNADGGLAIDTSTLVADAVNSRVGVSKLAPDETLDVGGNIAFGVSGFLYGRQTDGTKQRVFGIGGDNIAYIGGIDAATVEARLRVAGEDRLLLKDSGLVIDNAGLTVNEAGGSAATDDFRAESDTEANMVWLDASADVLYLGGSTNGIQVAKGGILSLIGSAIRSPTSSGTGTAGEICWDANYIYVCSASNTWKRVALTGGY